jgi:hypothetical protein
VVTLGGSVSLWFDFRSRKASKNRKTIFLVPHASNFSKEIENKSFFMY